MTSRIPTSGAIAVVVGGSSGIGAAIAHDLTASGATVVAADVAPSPGDVAVDITSSSSVDELVRHVNEEYGRCDYLVNCAGAVAVGSLSTLSEHDFDRVHAVNVKGPWLTIRAMVPLMTAGGSILNVASGAGLRPLPELSVYAASKAAVIALTRSLAGELADRNIRVNCLCPGLVDTPLARSTQNLRSAAAAQETQGFENYLIKRFGTPDELSSAALMLLANEYITGSTLAVDGGRTLH